MGEIYKNIILKAYKCNIWAIQHYQVGQIEGIKPIIGSEIGFVLDINNIQNEQNIGSICFLAQNYN